MDGMTYRVEVMDRGGSFWTRGVCSGDGWDWRIVDETGKMILRHNSGSEGEFCRTRDKAVREAYQHLAQLTSPPAARHWETA